jgi:hypothetical protein
MSELRQLEPGEIVRVINDGVPIPVTVTRHPDNGCVYYKFSRGGEGHSFRHLVFAAGEEQRLVKRLRDIAEDALRFARQIIEESNKEHASA